MAPVCCGGGGSDKSTKAHRQVGQLLFVASQRAMQLRPRTWPQGSRTGGSVSAAVLVKGSMQMWQVVSSCRSDKAIRGSWSMKFWPSCCWVGILWIVTGMLERCAAISQLVRSKYKKLYSRKHRLDGCDVVFVRMCE